MKKPLKAQEVTKKSMLIPLRIRTELYDEIERIRAIRQGQLRLSSSKKISTTVRALIIKGLQETTIILPEIIRDDIEIFRKNIQDQIPPELGIKISTEKAIEILITRSIEFEMKENKKDDDHLGYDREKQ